jgi:hypothetical protein
LNRLINALACTDQDNNGIRIRLLKDINKKDGSRTQGLGNNLKGKRNGMKLNNIMKNWNPITLLDKAIRSGMDKLIFMKFTKYFLKSLIVLFLLG